VDKCIDRESKAHAPDPPPDPCAWRCDGRRDPVPADASRRCRAANPLRQARLTAGTRTLDLNGKSARVFGLIGPNGKPGITLLPGERFHVNLVNEAGASTIVHWHGRFA
jgi:FtsP/CotA-like multicopper oxidase with cupredoxin domain